MRLAAFAAVVFATPGVDAAGVRGVPVKAMPEMANMLAEAQEEWLQQAQQVLRAETPDTTAREEMRASCVKVAGEIGGGLRWKRKRVAASLHGVCSSETMELAPRRGLCDAFAAGLDLAIANGPAPPKEGEEVQEPVDLSAFCLELYGHKVMDAAQVRHARQDRREGAAKDQQQQRRELQARMEVERHTIEAAVPVLHAPVAATAETARSARTVEERDATKMHEDPAANAVNDALQPLSIEEAPDSADTESLVQSKHA